MRKILPSLITDKGLSRLGNLVEEYLLRHDLSYEQLTHLELLLMTYYAQTGNLIHNNIFYQILKKYQKLPDHGFSYTKKGIEFLNRSECIEDNPNYNSLEEDNAL